MSSIRANLRQARDLIKARFYLPSHLRIGFRDFLDIRLPPLQLGCNASHIQAAIDWLCRAQDATHDGGVSARYRLDRGWTPSYPETTGYIIPTFFAYAKSTRKQEYSDRARRMSEWLLNLQLDNGAFPGHDISRAPQPVVFNTGQIALGLLSTFQETRDERFLAACKRAADWLLSIQEPSGAWENHTYLGRAHTYHTRVAWALLELWRLTSKSDYKEAALTNLNWAIDNQLPNGWFEKNGFGDNERPYLHTIAYTIRGLIESWAILDEKIGEKDFHRYFESAERSAEAIMHRFEIRRFPYAQHDRRWKSEKRYSCLTGNSQIALCWMRIYQITRDARYLNAAIKMNDFVKSTQDLKSQNLGIRGGIKGSHPVWGRYIFCSYPNWAAKFFADALLLEDELISQLYAEAGR